MRIQAAPQDFIVEEQINLALVPRGPWAVYRVRKVGLTTLDVQTRLASALNLSRRQVVFPALKDKEAVAMQYVALPAGRPTTIEGRGFRAEYVGQRLAPLSASDLQGNAFTLVLRDLPADEAARIAARLAEIGRCGVPNYFDTQRFGSLGAEGGYIGKAILRRDAEGALRAYLTEPFAGDPPAVRAFKRQAAALWPDWRTMFEVAPRPSNYRSVLTYLVDHPQDYRKALNLIPQRLLSLYLAAYQSYLWNRILAAYLARFYAQHGVASVRLTIADQSLPIHGQLTDALLAWLMGLSITLPNHRATFGPEIAPLVRDVLAGEGLGLDDLKARILQKAYLPKGKRPILLVPRDVRVGVPLADELFPARHKLEVRFALPPGSYATLVLKAAATSPTP